MTAESPQSAEPRASASALVQMLHDWERAGAHWQVVSHRKDQVTVALMRCDGGEEVDRITSTDLRVIAYLRAHDHSEGMGDVSDAVTDMA